ncbi:MAG: hypothetical protein ACYDB7_03515 [Mycobacteriales bacterium]
MADQAAVLHRARNEALTEVIAQPQQVTNVLAVGCTTGLDFDPEDPVGGQLHDGD